MLTSPGWSVPANIETYENTFHSTRLIPTVAHGCSRHTVGVCKATRRSCQYESTDNAISTHTRSALLGQGHKGLFDYDNTAQSN